MSMVKESAHFTGKKVKSESFCACFDEGRYDSFLDNSAYNALSLFFFLGEKPEDIHSELWVLYTGWNFNIFSVSSKSL